jgi:hypothetical protein
LCLQIGYDLPVPIPDLTIDDTGVRATLSFRREPFLCSVPWAAIYLIVDAESRGMLWEEDVPAQTRVPSPRKQPERRRLHSVPAAEEPGDGPPTEPTPPRPSRPQLKLVK